MYIHILLKLLLIVSSFSKVIYIAYGMINSYTVLSYMNSFNQLIWNNVLYDKELIKDIHNI